MTSDLDIYRTANVLVKHYGKDAALRFARANFATFKSKQVPCNYANFRFAFQVGENKAATSAVGQSETSHDPARNVRCWG